MKKRCLLIVVFAGAVAFAIAAAIAGPPNADQSAKASPVTTAAGHEKPAVSNVYVYNAKGRRDPFATLIVKAQNERRKGNGPLENYDVTEFKLTIVLWNKAGFYAVVAAPDGKNFTLREGMRLGLYGGKVYKIKKDSVIVREFLRDYRGSVNPKDTILKLRREEEG